MKTTDDRLNEYCAKHPFSGCVLEMVKRGVEQNNPTAIGIYEDLLSRIKNNKDIDSLLKIAYLNLQQIQS